MVKLTEVKNMFWGVTLDGGKRYTQIVEQSFHISMAALEAGTEIPKSKEKHVSVMIQHEKAEFVMCTLEYGRLYQQTLDLNFTEGEEVTFFLNGTGIVHLTGFLMAEDQYDDEDMYTDDSDMESNEEAPELIDMADVQKSKKLKEAMKRKAKQKEIMVSKRSKLSAGDDDDDDEEDDEDDDSDDEDIDLSQILEGESLSDMDDDDDDDDEEEEEEDEDEEEELPAKSPKQLKQQKKKTEQAQNTPSKQKTAGQNGIAETPKSEESAKKKKKKKKKKKNKNAEETGDSSTPSTPSSSNQQQNKGTPSQQGKDTPKKRVTTGNVIVEELKAGHGPEAKSGRHVQMYYVGTLAQDGKQFDSCKGGKPFKFRLGKGEVIKGWDVGVSGMKVGGKRKLTIPPAMGYGKQRQGPIPPNSTLVFEVELKAVS